MILTTTFMLFSFLVLLAYAWVARSARSWFADANRAMWFNRIAGALFVALGLGVIRLRNNSC